MVARITQSEMEERFRYALAYRTRVPDSIGAMLAFDYVSSSVEEGTATLSHKVAEREINVYGTLHGGIITWLMDSAMGTLARVYTGYEKLITVDIHVNFLRAVNVGDEVYITSRVTHAGSKIVNMVSELYVKEELMATSDSTFYKID